MSRHFDISYSDVIYDLSKYLLIISVCIPSIENLVK